MNQLKLLFILIFSNICYGQNIVNNGIFDCAYSLSAGYYQCATDWFNAGNFNGFSGTSVDNSCNNSWQFITGFPYPHTAVSGTIALGMNSNSSQTEGITTTFNTPINAGDSVTVEMWINVDPNNPNPNDPSVPFGVYLYSAGNVAQSGNFLTSVPQIVIPTTGLTVNTWTKTTVKYLATSSYTKMAIGFFNPTSFPTTVSRYFAIDDVVVTAVASPCGACPSGGSGATWTWTGCQDTDWFNACNWDRLSVPTVSSNVIIPSVTNDPLVNSGTANCLDITIQTGATVNINSTGGAVLNVTKP